MRKIRNYINSIYRPAFIMLCSGLAIFSVTICILAVSLRMDMLSGASDVIYRYPQMIEKILFPLYILFAITFVVDLNERTNKS